MRTRDLSRVHGVLLYRAPSPPSFSLSWSPLLHPPSASSSFLSHMIRQTKFDKVVGSSKASALLHIKHSAFHLLHF